MKKEDFSFDLPDELIAKFPSSERTDCRLLHLDGSSGRIDDRRFDDILQLLHPGDLLVFNDTRVIPARLFGKKATGGAIEILIERIIDGQSVLSHVRASKAPKTGSLILLDDGTAVEVEGRQGALFLLRFKTERSVVDVLDQLGHMPLPPYIDRSDEALDRERYQTVYSRNEGAVAAPTAGLHFDQPLLDRLREGGIQFAFVTLHVGSGTFQPVRVDDITSHEMHSEVMTVSQDVCDVIQRTKANGGRVIAVGTTSVRVLESASDDSGKLAPFQGETNIFIYPSYRFKVVDCLITNFHLPESTLIMLVSAFAGYHNTMQAYRHAVSQRYQFFSYGDAMFIEKNPESVTFERWRV